MSSSALDSPAKLHVAAHLRFACTYLYALARLGLFACQALAIAALDRIVAGKRKKLQSNLLRNLWRSRGHLNRLFLADARNVRDGVYSLALLELGNPVRHLARLPVILGDTIAVAARRKRGIHDRFSGASSVRQHAFPAYYTRNFHFQTDGYLSGASARKYDHQVEIVFAGTAAAMRRLILRPLRERFGHDGAGCHFLEVAGGTGALTRMVATEFPKARITLLELSPDYMEAARQNLRDCPNVSFVRGQAENLPFPDQHFDAAYSCYLLHEVPRDVRTRILGELARVLVVQGWIGHVDSIQQDDVPEFNWVLDQFPEDYHEPFYRDYTLHDLQAVYRAHGAGNLREEIGLFSKAVHGTKLHHA
ncbi:MAG TPA: class I SAM-dependent methyltransferase [Ramlibacter sp.]|uniref:class I SAM-dependent methyltransferase n=1 Tax=Ramlibacter sp. TaxID=1917967 RepID=UPI002D3FF816|nr:class I SAM-dependent methyltransferase [Ramlibacter sp.]HZY17805.1 class I SAM-dependent methyltransferase [Ramlibacter sp.]